MDARRTTLAAGGSVLAAAALLVACGAGDDDDPAGRPAAPPAVTGRPAADAGRSRPSATTRGVRGTRPEPAPGPALLRTRVELEDLDGADHLASDVKDDRGHNLEGLKVVATGERGPRRYLGLHHHRTAGGFVVAAVVSDDLVRWRHAATLGRQASQATVRRLPGGAYLVAWEQEPRNHVRVLHAPDLGALLAGRFDATFDAPLTLGETAEGTPDIRSARVGAGPGDSRIELGLHYYRDRDVDREATATLTDFRTWTARPRPQLDAAFERRGLRGNFGDRDTFVLRGRPYEVVEGQRRKGDWASWRTFLRDGRSGAMVPLRLRGADGQVALGNPTASVLPGPRGGTVLLRTAFAFSEGAPRGAGALVAWSRLP